jgi:hypothetical protein
MTSTTAAPSATLTEQLRAHVDRVPSKRRLALESGVPESSLSRFRSGERLLSAESMDRLVSTLGLDLTPRKAG